MKTRLPLRLITKGWCSCGDGLGLEPGAVSFLGSLCVCFPVWISAFWPSFDFSGSAIACFPGPVGVACGGVAGFGSGSIGQGGSTVGKNFSGLGENFAASSGVENSIEKKQSGTSARA